MYLKLAWRQASFCCGVRGNVEGAGMWHKEATCIPAERGESKLVWVVELGKYRLLPTIEGKSGQKWVVGTA